MASPLLALWLTWIGYAGATFVLAPLALLEPATGGIAAGVGLLLFLHTSRAVRGTPLPPEDPGRLRRLAPSVAALVGSGLALASMLRFDRYWGAPVLQLLGASALGIAPFGALLLLRWGWAGPRERRRWWTASAVVLATNAAWVSTLGLQLLFALHYPAFWLLAVCVRDGGNCPRRVGVFQFDAVGHVEGFDTRDRYVVAEQCSHDTVFSMCFSGAAGAGVYLAEPGLPHPAINQDREGALAGGWRWYVDD